MVGTERSWLKKSTAGKVPEPLIFWGLLEYHRGLMRVSSSTSLASALLLAACGSSHPKPPEYPPMTQASSDANTAHQTAQAEVKRLRAEAEQNKVLAPWEGPHGGVPPWDQAQAERFGSAFTVGLALRKQEVESIATDPAAPTFENTIGALEDAGRHHSRAETLFSVLTSVANTKEVQAVDVEWSPKIAAARDEITFNPKLFARIEAVYNAREGANLPAEQKRLLERTYEDFVREGARLSPEQKKELGAINQKLASLFTEFSNKLLADEDTWITIEKAEELAGLPDSLKAAFSAAAEERGLKGKWAIVNTRSSVDPFLTSSGRRELRERVWKAFKSRGDNGDANDTKATIAGIVKLRAERAKLLGYTSHAHWHMSDSMAKEPAKARELMLKVWPAAVARVREEVADMQKIADKEPGKPKIAAWDYLYYSEKVRKAKYDLDQNQLKPYFELGKLVDGAFYMAEQLYGLKFREITGTVPVLHAETRVWAVTQAPNGEHVGLFYGDYFARAQKRSGAWCQEYRNHETFTGKTIHTITSNNNNFVKGAPSEPVLISLDDAQTLFHEFGHAIHGLVSEVNYPGLGSTPNDFVEFPSQVHELWVLTRPILDRFATHYKTGKPMPQALLDKVEASDRFNQGYQTVEYLSSAILDMTLHEKPDGVVDAAAFERETLASIGAPAEVAMRHRLPQFGHLFSSDDYSAGYYSYLWSEVMDADTREAFAEAGSVFDPKTAAKLRQYILAPGNTTDRAQAYRDFRGRDPDVRALFRKRGFPDK
jgi:peptidyl-dipeptidase Dcp